MKGSLSQVLQSTQARPPKKFSQALVSDVHTRCRHVTDLQNILASGYFDAVLWRFFHADVSNSHLELLLFCCAYDEEWRRSAPHPALSHSPCLDLVLQSPEKLQALLLRVLQATMALRPMEAPLQVAVFGFLRVLVERSPALFDSSLYPKWKEALSTQLHSMDPTPNTAAVFQTFLALVSTCVSLGNDLGCHFRDVWVFFLQDAFDFRTKLFAQLLCPAEPTVKYADFVGAFDELKIQKIALANEPSVYGILAPALQSELDELSEAEITALQQKLVQSSLELPVSLRSLFIAYSVTGSGISAEKLANPTQFTEEDIFDLQPSSDILFMPSPHTLPTSRSLSASEWLECLRRQHGELMGKSFYERCVSVFSRLKIVDPDAENGISGSSKYFSPAKIAVKGSMANISTQKTLPFKKDQFCLLVELLKPNKFEATQRMVQYGVNAARVSRILGISSNSVTVQWNSSGFEDRFNAVIALPDTMYPPGPKPTPKLGSLTEKTRHIADSDSHPQKKRRVAESDSEASDLSSQVQFALSLEVSCIQAPAADWSTVQAILDQLKSCLVVFPTQAAVDLFPFRENCFRFDSNNSDSANLLRKRENLLTKVSHLSSHLDLQDYGFDKSVQNALSLYETHIQPKWRSFLRHVTESTFSDYPFGHLESPDIESITRHFAGVRQTFADLESVAAVDVDEDISHISHMLSQTANHVIVSHDQLGAVGRAFPNVVAFDPRVLPLVSFEKAVLVNCSVPAHVPRITIYSQDKASNVQYMRLTSEAAKLEEAQYCIRLHQYLLQQGVSSQSISVCCKSKYMEMLMQELLAENGNFAPPVFQDPLRLFPTDHMIVSSEGGIGFQDMSEIIAKSGSAYIFGADAKLPLAKDTGRMQALGVPVPESQLPRLQQFDQK